MKIGVLALQGAVREHMRSLEAIEVTALAIKHPQQLEEIDGLIIPGGESTTIGKLMRKYGFVEALGAFAAQGKPLFGTCAGLIVLAKRIAGQGGAEEPHLALMDITVRRNAFGRQRESFETDLDVIGVDEPVRAVFIRAPLITEAGPGVDVLCKVNEEIVIARQGHLLACSFHPELTDDVNLHRYFADMVKQSGIAAG
ncbi:pyridoxal 5'-phosphate synthase glutaminase subunit PdxT [Paenibacillus thiaminolyticus]|uniref:Pyridoxal 5'-phosphate synthase subunit PdxT n=1 Tax=Paenibacillus thiaminolyticus TaxID=49283 RepID=A0A3A3GGQ9_PANTH|nr:pyridoxal 5'-phosphate synthase glutaminase subunit PdxT [Paenibacillus thiaminolyticus]RJG21159.1 pyridoxal 5'-phosphate synthase glutaminase subunit PdxT [Paenibacillus thiaminolyticus]